MAKASSRVFFCMSSMATSTGVRTVCGESGVCTEYMCLCVWVHQLGPVMSCRGRRVPGYGQCWGICAPWWVLTQLGFLVQFTCCLPLGLGTLWLRFPHFSGLDGRGLHLEPTACGPSTPQTQSAMSPSLPSQVQRP